MNENQPSLSIQDLKKRAVNSFVSLGVRTVALRAISFITLNIILARVLPIEILGLFNIATGIITFFAFFSDIGLGASLIQKKDEISREDVKTVFSVQTIVVGILSLVIILCADLLAKIYGLNNDGSWLIRALGISFFLSSLKVVPSVLLERELKFQPLVIVEVVETLIYNLLLIVLVFRGMGIWSFTWAALSRGVVGTILIYLLAQTKVGVGFNRLAARQLLSFGVPFQLNSLLSLLKDRLVPLVVAGMVGARGMSYITWAQSMAFLPLELMNITIRITFPAFSRLQHNKEALATAVEKSLFVTTLLVYPAIFGIGALLPSLVTHVVTDKFVPAINSYYLFAFATLWSVISTTFTNTLNAIGQVKTTLKLMVMWTTLEWVLTPVLVYFYGFIGVAVGSFIISFSSVITIVLIKRVLKVRVMDSVILPLLCSSLMGAVVFLIAKILVVNYLTFGVAVLLGGLIYALLVMVFGQKRIMEDLKSLRALRQV